MASPVEQIKEKLSIVDVVGSYVELENAGKNFKAKCPFHNEKTPSFYVSPARNSYYCFGCGAKGDIFSFVEQFEGVDFIGALRVLGRRAGVEIKKEDPTVRTERERDYHIMEQATIFFQIELSKRQDAKDYILKRGLTPDTAKSWRLGYAPLEWKSLSLYLQKKGFKTIDIERVGLIKKSDKEQGDYYDRFRGRVMFPIFDSSGRVIAFSGRQFENDGTEAKYLNSPETPLFEKSKVLYGFDRAKLEIRKRNFALLVEGQMDLLMAHQAGYTNAVASSGTALTLEQLELIKRLAPKIIIAYDSDDAGNNAAARGWKLALEVGLDVEIVVLPPKKDPADLILEDPAAFGTAITMARHIIDVKLSLIMQQSLSLEEKRKQIEQEILPLIASLQSETEKSKFAVMSSYEAKISEVIIWEAIRNLTKVQKTPQFHDQEKRLLISSTRYKSILRMLFSLYFWQENTPTITADNLDIYSKICNIVGNEEIQQSLDQYKPHKDELIFEAEVSFQYSSNIKKYVAELLLSLEEEWLREKFADAMRDLQSAEKNKDHSRVQQSLKICQDLSNRLRVVTQKLQQHDEK